MPSDKRQAAWRFDAMLLGLVRSCANSVYLWILRQADPVEGEGKGGTSHSWEALTLLFSQCSSCLRLFCKKKKKEEEGDIFFRSLLHE
jgi:hypothetical protein